MHSTTSWYWNFFFFVSKKYQKGLIQASWTHSSSLGRTTWNSQVPFHPSLINADCQTYWSPYHHQGPGEWNSSFGCHLAPQRWCLMGKDQLQDRDKKHHISVVLSTSISEKRQPANIIWKWKQATWFQTSVMILLSVPLLVVFHHTSCNFICSKICPTIARFPDHNRADSER